MDLLFRFFIGLGLCTAASAQLHGGYLPQNFTKGSVFEKNVNHVLGYINEQTPLRNTSTISYGDFPDTVYGLGQCLNSSIDCAFCIRRAIDWLRSVAPLARGGAANDTSRCFARYEAYNFLPALAPPPYVPTPEPSRTTSGSPPSRSRKTVVIAASVAAGAIVLSFGAFLAIRIVNRHGKKESRSSLTGSLEGPIIYTYKELQEATDNFSERNKLGKGGFGTVYKGTTANGTKVAVKKLYIPPDGPGQGETHFVNEVRIIGHIQHRNLVKLKGYCIQGNDRMLVLEYFMNGSLDHALLERGLDLDWATRYGITVGVARGLAYLHEESSVRIIHRDIKSSNILLDDKLEAKISDFGVSKLFDPDQGVTSTINVAGTYGYLAPEYAMRGHLTSKADVFSYGVVVLEIISGQRCNHDGELLIAKAWKLYETGDLERLVDPRLKPNQVRATDAARALQIALLCTQRDEECRPSMSEVVAMLMGYLELPQAPMQSPSFFGFAETRSTTTSTSATTTTSQSISKSNSKSMQPSARPSFTTSFDQGAGR